MRIIIVSRVFGPEASAASQRLASLAASLVERGAAVQIITTRAPRGAGVPDDGPLEVSRWPVLRDRTGYVRGYVPYLSFDLPAFFRLACARRFDVLVVEPPPTTGAAARLAAALRRRPYVYYAADIWSIAAKATGAPGVVVRVVRALEAFALRGAAAVLAVSEGVAEQVVELAPRARVTVVGHGVDDRTYHGGVEPSAAAAEVVYVGTASEWHGAGVFIEALSILSERGVRPRVAFVGNGADWDSLRDGAARAGLDNVVFGSAVPPDAAAAILRAARVALASVRVGVGYDFAVPTKMYAALAVGTPVLFAGPEQLRDLVRDERLGWGCPPHAVAVADAIEAAVTTPPSEADRARLVDWAANRVSARVVSGRSASVVEAAASMRHRR